MSLEPAAAPSASAPRDLRKYHFFHPLVWFTAGYLVWMLIPPFFTENGHHYLTVVADLIGYGFVVAGFLAGAAVKNAVAKNAKVTVKLSDGGTLVLSFIAIVYAVRLILFSEVGIYAFLHPYSRQSSLFDTVAQVLSTPYIVLLMTMLWVSRKPIYVLLLMCEVVLFVIPTMARSYYVVFPLYFLFVTLYYGRFDLASKAKVFAPIILGALVFIALVGPYINAVRSYATIGEYEKGLDLEFAFEERKSEFLINRFNVHGESFQIEPVVKDAVSLDTLSLRAMLNKWLGYASTYEVHPTSVATEVGLMLGYGARTSTDFPRNLVLVNYPWAPLALVLFNFALGVLLAWVYKTIFKADSLLFMTLWVPLVFSPAFAGQGAFPSTFVFQYVFALFSFAAVFSVFIILRTTARLAFGIVNAAVTGRARAHSSSVLNQTAP